MKLGKIKPKKSDYDEMIKQILTVEKNDKKEETMKSVFHQADTRGFANHGWLEARHSFSFASWYNPERVHFGALRVLNDDKIQGGMGFGTHPHDNMEIITIPLEGALAHKDSMGNGTTIQSGDIQVMSAGSGIMHSEFNANEQLVCKLLQIWVFPNAKNVTPRYDQITLDQTKMENELYQIVSPSKEDDGVWIHQNAWFHIGNFDQGKQFQYQLKREGNGVYIFLIDGHIRVENQDMEKRDGFGIWETRSINFSTLAPSKILVMEVPMEF